MVIFRIGVQHVMSMDAGRAPNAVKHSTVLILQRELETAFGVPWRQKDLNGMRPPKVGGRWEMHHGCRTTSLLSFQNLTQKAKL